MDQINSIVKEFMNSLQLAWGVEQAQIFSKTDLKDCFCAKDKVFMHIAAMDTENLTGDAWLAAAYQIELSNSLGKEISQLAEPGVWDNIVKAIQRAFK